MITALSSEADPIQSEISQLPEHMKAIIASALSSNTKVHMQLIILEQYMTIEDKLKETGRSQETARVILRSEHHSQDGLVISSKTVHKLKWTFTLLVEAIMAGMSGSIKPMKVPTLSNIEETTLVMAE